MSFEYYGRKIVIIGYLIRNHLMERTSKIIILLVTILIIIVSCNPQKKFATDFVTKSDQFSIMVLSPEFVYKNNLNTLLVDSLNITDEFIRDSILWQQSHFFKELNDSLFIANYILGYKVELEEYNVNIFDEESSMEFLEKDSNSYMINIAQLEIEEEDYDFRDETTIYDYVYFHDHKLKAVNINSWFEINMINDSSEENLFYTTNTITDDLNSSFDYNIFNGEVEYIHEIDSLTVHKIYEYAYLLGRIYATYTYDFMMNRYISKNQGYAVKKGDLLRFNPNTNTFFIAGENRFISMDE